MMNFFSRATLPQPGHPIAQSIEQVDAMVADIATPPPIFSLPPEIIQHVLSYLAAPQLVSLSRTCKSFNDHATREHLWLELLRPNIPPPDFPHVPSPASSYKELYLSHHPYWHLPRHKIWFSDDAYNGKLILVKFDPRRGSIEGYRLAAERPIPVVQNWSLNPSVVVHHVDPRVYVSTEDPMLTLSLPYTQNLATQVKTRSQREIRGVSSELRMRIGRSEQRINAALMLAKDLPPQTANTRNVAVWPPRTIPDMPRTRSSTGGNSSDKFRGTGHKPQTVDEISQTTFRLRMWSQFTQGMLSLGVRIAEEVSTWSTLDPLLYTPTSTKPYQGIFIGDYASHGYEFLLVLQTDQAPYTGRRRSSSAGDDNDSDADEGVGIARRNSYIATVLAALREQQFIHEDDIPYMMAPSTLQQQNSNIPGSSTYVRPNVPDPDGTIHRGALEAIKLTGDVNIPRGEHTFIADDISDAGLVRIAAEAPFRGARVVKSKGHVAERGFRNDKYIPSQLFLISPDVLAQYWLPYGHISYYKRVNIDELLQDTLNGKEDKSVSE